MVVTTIEFCQNRWDPYPSHSRTGLIQSSIRKSCFMPCERSEQKSEKVEIVRGRQDA